MKPSAATRYSSPSCTRLWHMASVHVCVPLLLFGRQGIFLCLLVFPEFLKDDSCSVTCVDVNESGPAEGVSI